MKSMVSILFAAFSMLTLPTDAYGAGGWKAIEKGSGWSDDLQAAAKFGIEAKAKEEKKYVAYASVENGYEIFSAEQQVVSGINYKIVVKPASAECEHLTLMVWSQPWMTPSMRLMDSSSASC